MINKFNNSHILYLHPTLSAIIPYVTKEHLPTTTNSNQSISRFMTCIKDIATFSITVCTFKTPTACLDLNYENYAINKGYLSVMAITISQEYRSRFKRIVKIKPWNF